MPILRVLVTVMVATVVAACVEAQGGGEDEPIDATRGEGKRDGLFVGDDSPEEFGVLRVANELSERQLVSEAHLGSRAAAAVVRFRAGRDGQEGTADDWRFEGLDELDAVPYIGDTSIEKLAEHAQARGWIPSPPALVSTTPASGSEGFDRCGTLEMRFSQPLDPESLDIQTSNGLRVTVEGDRVLARGFTLSGPASLSVRLARAAGGGPPAKDWSKLQVRVAETGSPTLVRPWPEGTGAAIDGSVGVDVCGVVDKSVVSLRLLDGGQEVPLGPPVSNSAMVWRQPLSPLAAGHAYDVEASVAGGPTRRWRFTTAAHAFHRESLALTERTVLDAASDGTVVAYTPGDGAKVGRLGGTFTDIPGWRDVVRAFAQPGGGARGVWEDDSTVWSGTWTPAGSSSIQVGIGFVMEAFGNGWIAMEQRNGLTLATPGVAGFRTELVKGGAWPVVEDVKLGLAPQGTVWLAWRDRDSDDAFVSRRTASGWTHHALRNQTYEHPAVELDGAGELHILTDADYDGVVSWRIDDNGKEGPMRRLGGGPSLSDHDARFVPDGRGNLLAAWTTAAGGWVRWWQGDLGAWGPREALAAKITEAVAGPDGTIYALADGGVWSGARGRAWERIADAPESHLAVLAGTVAVYGRRGLYLLDR